MARTTILILGFALSVVSLSQAHSADKRPGAFIVSPKEGATVGRTSELVGKTFLRGQPLALVRAVEGNGHWWVQRSIQRNDRGQLKGKIQFGNDLAEHGTRFAFVVVVVQTRLELEFFTENESLAELPDNVPKSAIRNVVLGRPGNGKPGGQEPVGKKPGAGQPKAKPRENPPPAPAGNDPPTSNNDDPPAVPSPNKPKEANPKGSVANKGALPSAGDKGKPTKLGLAILKPLENAKVQRFEELVGRMESEDKPIVLVRPEGVDEQWWVQDKVTVGDGKYFKTKLRFGNDKTPAGTRFMVLVVSPEPGPETNAMKPGTAFFVLPRGIRRSKEVIVQLGPPTKPAGAK